jgi:hypothetical protein
MDFDLFLVLDQPPTIPYSTVLYSTVLYVQYHDVVSLQNENFPLMVLYSTVQSATIVSRAKPPHAEEKEAEKRIFLVSPMNTGLRNRIS